MRYLINDKHTVPLIAVSAVCSIDFSHPMYEYMVHSAIFKYKAIG